MNYKLCLLFTSIILPSFLPLHAYAISLAEATVLAQDVTDFYALDDETSILKGTASITGNVTTNDKGFLTVKLTSPYHLTHVSDR